MASLSVVIPTWNGLRYLPQCLTALSEQTRLADEIVVVDNGSTDGTVDLLRARHPRVGLVINEHNRGVAEGINQGILAARGEIIVALNNDTVPEPGCLAALAAPLEADPALGAVAGVLVFASRPDRVNAAGVSMGRDLVALEVALGQPVASLPTTPWPVFGPSAGAAAYRRAALDDVGLFDGRFFAYLEDVDLAWRLRLRGWPTVANPAARIAHLYSATAGASSAFKRYYLARNRIGCLVKNVPAALWRRHAAAVLWYDMVALAAALASGDTAWLRGRRDGLRALPDWLAERRSIQARSRVDSATLEAILTPRVGPLGVWRTRRLVRQVLHD